MRELHLDMIQCGQLPLPRVWEIFKYFKVSPPVHLFIRAWFGYEAQEADSEQPLDIPAELAGAPKMRDIPAHILRDIELRKGTDAT